MALQLKLSRVGINKDGTEMYLSDVTGPYAATTNKGGWGVPNQLRAEKALLLQGFQRGSTVDGDAVFADYDPETVANFTMSPTVDGYYEIYMIAVDKIVPIVEGAYGWTAATGLVQLVGGIPVAKTVNDVYNDILFLDKVSFKTVLLANSTIYKNHKLLELYTEGKANNSDKGHVRKLEELKSNFEYVKVLLESARLFWCSNLYTESQLAVESLNELVVDDVRV